MEKNISESRMAELWNLARSNDAHGDLLSMNEKLVLDQYRAINGALVKSWHDAPPNLIESIKSIMPPTSRSFSIGRLVQSRPQFGFARGAVSQIQFETDEVTIRIQMEEIPNGCRMWGRASQPGWEIWSGSSKVACNDHGEFEMDVLRDSVEPLSMQNGSSTILLPLGNGETGHGDA